MLEHAKTANLCSFSSKFAFVDSFWCFVLWNAKYVVAVRWIVCCLNTLK